MEIHVSKIRIYLVIYRKICKFYRNILPFITGVERCSFPVEWDGEWHDSSDIEQDITFTRSSSYVEGWKHTIFLDTITSWTCVDQETSNNLLLFKSIKPFISSHCYTTIRKIPNLHMVFISILDPNKQYMYLEHDRDCIAVSNGRS